MDILLPQATEMLEIIPDGNAPLRLADRLPSPEGGVWVGPYIMKVGIPDDLHRDSADPWIAIRSDGSLESMVSVPERFAPMLVCSGYMIGIRRDEFGIEYVERLELTPLYADATGRTPSPRSSESATPSWGSRSTSSTCSTRYGSSSHRRRTDGRAAQADVARAPLTTSVVRSPGIPGATTQRGHNLLDRAHRYA